MQPKRSKKSVDDDRQFDQTQLRSSQYGYNVHRDYAAHFFRWGFAGRFIGNNTKVLDPGCGQDLALLRVLSGHKQSVPAKYVGCDLNKIQKIPSRQWATVLPEFNFIKDHKKIIAEHGLFDVAVNLEVIEHMPKATGLKLLKAIYACLKPGGMLILSTPVFNGKAAANHIHEYSVGELAQHIKKAGFFVAKRYGTFASYHEIKKVLTVEQRETYEALREYYTDEVCACFLAPLYPDNSRNNVWILEK